MTVHHCRRPARRAAALLGVASVIVTGSIVGAQAAAAGPQRVDPGAGLLATSVPASTSPAPRPSTPTQTPTMPQDRAGCEAAYEVLSEWPGGFVAQVRVVNVSTFSSLEGWTVRVELPAGEATHAWSSTVVTDADGATFRAASWNSFLTSRGTAEFGFQGTGSPTPGTVTCSATPR
ncbi:cellulose-binding family II [Cellulomonas flavigena DSM 20109]|uniref:Cellulose-binding family II n=1 Tax=Cellulomonas flavigena (strain ATCC 482 / DSM 20109 / BCRC 11376 / JCM 18109 / NBRC 3775 / NCIMB 8073 / NRS 134) TaxID=446466 RepID=D5UC93_CELFN|nr:cellulose binding domain-containing protein [Cellulomonas flavigena]ADG74207.1 cellulose-binding family II [Cellulomonas flavigena DSM 20109]